MEQYVTNNKQHNWKSLKSLLAFLMAIASQSHSSVLGRDANDYNNIGINDRDLS